MKVRQQTTKYVKEVDCRRVLFYLQYIYVNMGILQAKEARVYIQSLHNQEILLSLLQNSGNY